MNGVSTDLYAYDGDHVELSECHYHKCGYEPNSKCKDTVKTPDIEPTEVSYLNKVIYEKENVLCIVHMIFFLQLWERECKCGKGPEKNGVVQIFEDTLEVKNTAILNAPSLKKPLCLGTLISEYHILTTKLCFGTDDKNGEYKQTESTFDSLKFSQFKHKRKEIC